MGWGAAVGGAVSGLMEGLTSIGQGIFSDIQAKKAYRRQKTILKNRIRWATEDMLRAGINPMTAFIGGGSVPTGSASVSVAQTPSRPDVSGAVQRGMAAVQEVKQREADRKLTETLKSKADTERLESYERQAAIQQNMWLQRNFEAPLKELEAQSRRAQIENTRITNQLMETQLPSAKALGEFYEAHPEAKQLDAVFQLLSRGLHGAQQVQGLSR